MATPSTSLAPCESQTQASKEVAVHLSASVLRRLFGITVYGLVPAVEPPFPPLEPPLSSPMELPWPSLLGMKGRGGTMMLRALSEPLLAAVISANAEPGVSM